MSGIESIVNVNGPYFAPFLTKSPKGDSVVLSTERLVDLSLVLLACASVYYVNCRIAVLLLMCGWQILL